jgi:hypothetical protein
MDAPALLANDHAVVKDLFSRYGELGIDDRARKASLWKRLREELDVHSAIEEELFYPVVRTANPVTAGMLVGEALEEHRLIRQILKDLDREVPGSDEFDAKLNVLRENVLRHAREEEETIFEEARSSMTPLHLNLLGGRLADRKHELGGTVHRPVPVMAAKAKRAFARVRQMVSRSTRGSRGMRVGRSRRSAVRSATARGSRRS